MCVCVCEFLVLLMPLLCLVIWWRCLRYFQAQRQCYCRYCHFAKTNWHRGKWEKTGKCNECKQKNKLYACRFRRLEKVDFSSRWKKKLNYCDWRERMKPKLSIVVAKNGSVFGGLAFPPHSPPTYYLVWLQFDATHMSRLNQFRCIKFFHDIGK